MSLAIEQFYVGSCNSETSNTLREHFVKPETRKWPKLSNKSSEYQLDIIWTQAISMASVTVLSWSCYKISLMYIILNINFQISVYRYTISCNKLIFIWLLLTFCWASLKAVQDNKYTTILNFNPHLAIHQTYNGNNDATDI